ncbi:hypothetical protein [Clostridium sp.]|uniref:hypothetical protein n=1 Tax=Clostridium sp. TaxID=1506 RepID=UPI00293107C6|nr:hypothetical protein [Clostridium sp.]
MLDCREISAKNSNGRGCVQKCLLQKASFWTNNFGTASAKEFLAEISNTILRIFIY